MLSTRIVLGSDQNKPSCTQDKTYNSQVCCGCHHPAICISIIRVRTSSVLKTQEQTSSAQVSLSCNHQVVKTYALYLVTSSWKCLNRPIKMMNDKLAAMFYYLQSLMIHYYLQSLMIYTTSFHFVEISLVILP